MRSGLVEMEEALNAEQVVESERGMQFCASVTEVDEASRPSKNGFFIALVLLFDRIVLRHFCCERKSILPQSLVIVLLAWSQVYLRALMSLDFAGGFVAYSHMDGGLRQCSGVQLSPTLPKTGPDKRKIFSTSL
jgi:hypothetical protein